MRGGLVLWLALALAGCGGSGSGGNGNGGGAGGGGGFGGSGGSGGGNCGKAVCPGQCVGKWCAEADVGGMLFTDVWGSAPDDVWVLAQGATIRHFDGQQWTETALPTSYDVDRVWGRSKTDVWVGGGPGQLAHYDGKSWTLDPLPVADRVLGFTAASTSDPVLALTSSGTLFERQAAGWTPTAVLPTTGWAGRAGKPHACDGKRYVPGKQIYTDASGEWIGHGIESGLAEVTGGASLGTKQTWVAVGKVLRHDGASWTWPAAELAFGDVKLVAGTSETDVWAVAVDGRLLHSTGGAFKEALSASKTGTVYWMHSSAVGSVDLSDPSGSISRWDGKTLTSIVSGIGSLSNADGVGWTTSGDAFAFGATQLFALDTASKSWKQVAQDNTVWNGAAYIGGTSPTDVWIAKGSDVHHWDGNQLTKQDLPFPGSYSYPGLLAFAPNDVWLAGKESTHHFDGTAWKHASDPTEQPSYASDRAAVIGRPQDLWVVRGGGHFAHFDGAAFTEQKTLTPSLGFVGCSPSPGELLGVAIEQGAIMSGKPGAMQVLDQVKYTFEVTDAWIGAPDDAWMVGHGTSGGDSILRFDGQFSTSIESSSLGTIALWAFPGGDAWVVGYDSILHHSPQ